ncbi:hypothetical protein HRI_004688000 [Hibiscus trionum]|uniref:RING-type E3 ubiquitin transferase n=1 Tax=Hibiscus trionum TaxID=183268 RepID=A0A9W7J8S0_HIBTR|nr:hypothetical protein HRI_004688000 [Hibiscus trionum]
MASPPLPNNNELSNVNHDLHIFMPLISACFIGLLIVLFIRIFDQVFTWLGIEAIDQLDIESGQLTAYHPSLTDDFDWSHEPMSASNLWVSEIFNGFMAYLAERRDPGLSPELFEQVSPCVSYKSLGATTLDECVICLEGFGDDEMCRVFPVCNHVFHSGCLDSWLRNHLTCPICRNSIVDRSPQ